MDQITLSVAGRGRMTATATADRAAVVVRLDSDSDPSFWAEVTIPMVQLADLLASIPPPPQQVALVSSEVEAWATGRFTEEAAPAKLPGQARRFDPRD